MQLRAILRTVRIDGFEQPEGFNKVRAIKALRNITNLALKEANEVLMEVMQGGSCEVSLLDYSSTLIQESLDVIRSEGFRIDTKTPLDTIRDLAIQSIKDGNYELAGDLTAILNKHVR